MSVADSSALLNLTHTGPPTSEDSANFTGPAGGMTGFALFSYDAHDGSYWAPAGSGMVRAGTPGNACPGVGGGIDCHVADMSVRLDITLRLQNADGSLQTTPRLLRLPDRVLAGWLFALHCHSVCEQIP